VRRVGAGRRRGRCPPADALEPSSPGSARAPSFAAARSPSEAATRASRGRAPREGSTRRGGAAQPVTGACADARTCHTFVFRHRRRRPAVPARLTPKAPSAPGDRSGSPPPPRRTTPRSTPSRTTPPRSASAAVAASDIRAGSRVRERDRAASLGQFDGATAPSGSTGVAERVCSIRSGRQVAMGSSGSVTRRSTGLAARSAPERYRALRARRVSSQPPSASCDLRLGQ
jgi:hypothetical protein